MFFIKKVIDQFLFSFSKEHVRTLNSKKLKVSHLFIVKGTYLSALSPLTAWDGNSVALVFVETDLPESFTYISVL